MLRSLWTGAAGMKAQQSNVDTVANNLANVNTVGFKSQTAQFKTLLYQTLREESTTGNGDPKPTSAQVGLGTRIASLNTNFTQGAQLANDSNTALCINGSGFFAVRTISGEVAYTRSGNFTWSLDQDGNRILTTSQGEAVLDYDGNPISAPAGYSADSVSFGSDGVVAFRNEEGVYEPTGQRVAIYQFSNPVGLNKDGDSLYLQSDASGAPLSEATTQGLITSTISQNYLEGSNVNVADEMVNLIIAQRAYELNSRAITTSDTMLEQANALKR